MRHFLGWSVVLLACACGSDDKSGPSQGGEEVEQIHSGSRLTLRWADFAGTKVLDSLVDSQRGEDCSPLVWADGKTYCTPKIEGEMVYRDAECKLPMGRYSRPSPAGRCVDPPDPYFLITRELDRCTAERISLHHGTVNAADRFYRKVSDRGECVEEQRGTDLLYDLGPEISRSELVEITAVAKSGGGRLQFRYGETQDGARVSLGTDDAMLEGTCTLLRSQSSEALSCLPDSEFSSFYSNSTCTDALTRTGALSVAPFTACKPAKYAAISDRSCADNWTLHRTTDQRSDTLYRNYGTCSAATPIPQGQAYFKAIDPVPAARLSRQPPPNANRITPVFYSDGVVRKHVDLLHDSMLDVDCKATRLPDGTTRCLPNGLVVETFYSDAACTVAIKAAELATCATAPAKYGVELGYDPCQSDYTVYAIGEKLEAPLYQSSAGRCEQRSGVVAYRAGPVLPLDQLAPATFTFQP